MKVLAISDLHGDHGIYKWLVQISNQIRPDVVVLAGDLLGCPGDYSTVEESQQKDALQIIQILKNVQAPIFYVMGNDDMVELEPGDSNIKSIHDRRVELKEYNFVGYQFILPFMAGVFEKPETEIKKDIDSLASQIDDRTVFVTHSPIYGKLDVGIMDVNAGSVSLKEVVEQKGPVAHIHGHIHSCFGVSGRHFNVAAAGNRRAIEIDLMNCRHRVIAGSVV